MKQLILFLYLLSLPSLSMPLANPTVLPYPNGVSDAEQDMLAEVINLQVYPDSQDPHLFYYIPPFHIRQYSQGAASMLLSPLDIGFFTSAQKALAKKDTYSAEQIIYLEKNVAEAYDDLLGAEQRLADAFLTANPDIIKLRQSTFDFLQARHEKLIQEFQRAQKIVESGGTILPEGLRREINRAAVGYIGMAGIKVDYFNEDSPEKSDLAVGEGMADLANSEAGYLNLNVYAGFSAKQLRALRDYKYKYYPHIKIALMPSGNMEFFPLAEPVKEDRYQRNTPEKPARFIKNIFGSGDYLGATVSLRASVSGGMALAAHLGPFVLPMGIKTELKFETETTDLELDCDFSKEFSYPGRNTIKPNLYIFDGPGNLMLMNKVNKSMCKIKVNQGDEASVDYWIEKTIEDSMFEAGAIRMMLGMTERMAYSDMIEAATGLPYIPPRFYRLDRPGEVYSYLPPFPLLGGYAIYPEYHFAVESKKIAQFSKLKFKKHLHIPGQEKIKKDLPVNLCLVYNPVRQVYDRCTELEVVGSNTMAGSAQDALNSSECSGTNNPFECGVLRNNSANLSREPRNFDNDGALVGGI